MSPSSFSLMLEFILAIIAFILLKAGIIVVGLARRVDRVEELASQVDITFAKSLHAFKCDVSKEDDILKAFKWVDDQFGGADILVYSAGVCKQISLIDADNTADIQDTLNTNVLGLVFSTREAFQSMKRRSVTDGHVVLINSVYGHSVNKIPGLLTSINMYAPSKYAVTALTEVLRQEFQSQQTQIKITSISPGIVLTEMVPGHLRDLPALQAEDISAAVMYCIGTPPRVQVHELQIRPIGEQF